MRNTLYLAVICHEARMDRIKTTVDTDDGPVWEDDCIEIFVDIDHDHRSYCQFVLSARGTPMDARLLEAGRLDTGWNATWQHAVRQMKNRWCAEIAIPLNELDGPPANVIGLNVAREERPHSELSSWMPQQRHFAFTVDELIRFADVVVEEHAAALDRLEIRPLQLGENHLSARIGVRSGPDAGLLFNLFAPDGEMAGTAYQRLTSSTDFRHISLTVPIPLRTLHQGTYILAAQLTSSRRTGPERLAAFPIQVEETAPLSLVSEIIVGRDTPLRVRVAPVLSADLLRSGSLAITLRAPDTKPVVHRVALSPLAPDAAGILEIPPPSRVSGALRIAAQIVDAAGKDVSSEVETDVVLLPGPFDLKATDTLVPNPSFEDGDGDAIPGWRPVWWAPASAGLAPVPPAEFVRVQRDGASEGASCLRIRSTRNGDIPANEVLHVRSGRIDLMPGTRYRLTVACRTEGLEGRGKIWLQLPTRQLVIIDGIRDVSHWRDIEADFTPTPDETWAEVCLALDGKAGTVWYDRVRFGPAPPALIDLLAPNSLMEQGVCRLAGTSGVGGLTVAFSLFGCNGRGPIATWAVPATADRLTFTLPDTGGAPPARLVARLTDAGGRVLDALGADIFLAPPPFGD
jgi:hypothetical protein